MNGLQVPIQRVLLIASTIRSFLFGDIMTLRERVEHILNRQAEDPQYEKFSPSTLRRYPTLYALLKNPTQEQLEAAVAGTLEN